MGVLKRLFGGERDQNVNPSSASDDSEQFDGEWFAALSRFKVVAGFRSFSLELLDGQTEKPIKPYKGLPEAFDLWKQIKSPWDRRRLLFEVILDRVHKSMMPWQIANILTANREPDKALALLENNPQPALDSDDYAQHCATYAKTLIALLDRDKALEWARLASETDPDNRHFRVELADALALTGNCEEANQIFSTLLGKNSVSQAHTISEMFSEVFSCESGILPSPVFALQIAGTLTDQVQADEFWSLAEDEFYDSPYFRMYHAFRYADQGKIANSMAKLITLVQEMPWLKEASLNLRIMFEKFDPEGKVMPEFQAQLRQTIQDNGWTTEGMVRMQIGQD